MKLYLRVLLAEDELVVICVHHWGVWVECLRVAILEEMAVQLIRISQDLCRDDWSMTTQSLGRNILLLLWDEVNWLICFTLQITSN
jgi:hypothetical protein